MCQVVSRNPINSVIRLPRHQWPRRPTQTPPQDDYPNIPGVALNVLPTLSKDALFPRGKTWL
jgi:hypothetical protein